MSRLSKVGSSKNTFGIPSDATQSNYGAKVKYNNTYNLVLVSDPKNKYATYPSGYLASGSGAVYVYTYTSHTPTLAQKIYMPESTTSGKWSTRHSGALFGQDFDIYQDWLIIGCPKDKYSNTGTDISYITIGNIEYFGIQSGSAYIYQWNGSSYDYIQKLSPYNLVESNGRVISSSVLTDTILRQQSSSAQFGYSIAIDKSSLTTFSNTDLVKRKYSVIGGPTASDPRDINSVPSGGIWLLQYTNSTWSFASERINPQSFGGVQYGFVPSNTYEPDDHIHYENSLKTQDKYGILFNNSKIDYPTPAVIDNISPPLGTASYSTIPCMYGANVAVGGVTSLDRTVIIVGAPNATFSVTDTYDSITKNNGHIYYYILENDPSHGLWLRMPSVREDDNLFTTSSVNDSYFQNVQMYAASDVMNGDFSINAYYSSSFGGYNSFLESGSTADTTSNVYYVRDQIGLTRGSLGYISLVPLINCTYETQTSGTEYVENESFIISERVFADEKTIGHHATDLKIVGKYAFISIPNLARHTDVVGQISGYNVVQYEAVSAILIADLDYIDGTSGYGGPFSSSNGNRLFLLPAPNDYRLNGGIVNCVAGYGINFDVVQISSTEWILSVAYLSPNTYSESSGEAYDVLSCTSKVSTYRITEGDPPSIIELWSCDLIGVNTSDFTGSRVIYDTLDDGSPYKKRLREFYPKIRTRFINTAIKYVSSTDYDILSCWDSSNVASKSLYSIYTTSYPIEESAFIAFVL